MLEETIHERADTSLETTLLTPTFTPALYSRLSILAVNRRASREELQRKLGVSQSQMYDIVGKLKRLGLIEQSDQTPANLRVVSIELTPAGEAALHAPAPVGRKEISPAVVEILEILRAGEQGMLTAEQLALPLARSEVREVLSCSSGEPFPEARLHDLIRRRMLLPLPSRRRGAGYRLHYSLESVLDLIEKLKAPKNEITFELGEVLEVLRTQGPDHLTQLQLDLPLHTAEVVVLATYVLGKPFPQKRIYDLCRRKYNRLQTIGPRRGQGYRLLYRVGDVLKALASSR